MRISKNSMAIIILCSHLCVGDDIKPFEPNEWTKFADKLLANNLQPHDILSFSSNDFSYKFNYNSEEIKRIQRLIDRSASLTFEIEKYSNMGINIITRADAKYPKKLKDTLGKRCPPLFYFAGDIELVDKKLIGFVGSRSVEEIDELFTQKIVSTITSNGYSVVSGGAKGVDSISSKHAIENGYSCVEYISDSLIKKIRSKGNINAIQKNQLLILSVTKPDAGFNAGIAMMRNRFIYAQSDGTVVVKADYNKGGTWNGAIDNLKHQYCPGFCWENNSYKGNMELIKNGAIAIDENWDGNVIKHGIKKAEEPIQLSLFE